MSGNNAPLSPLISPVRPRRRLHRSRRVVNSQNSVREWRSRNALAEGASEALANNNQEETERPERSEPDGSYLCLIMADLQWAIQQMTQTATTGDSSNDSSNGRSSENNNTLSVAQTEEWAILLHATLTHQRRSYYHGLAHVFAICAGGSPVQVLASLVRDLVCHWIDGVEYVHPRHGELLEGVFVHVENDGNNNCNNTENNTQQQQQQRSYVLTELTDPADLCIVHLFGFKAGMDLKPYQEALAGMDVFLSTLLAARLLRSILRMQHIVSLAVCLEATIPFRGPQQQEGGPLERLYSRLVDCNQLFNVGFTEEQMIRLVQEAADMHNRVVGNMSSEDLAEFLDHTWRLLPEQHASLRNHALYRLTDYYTAIQGMVTMTQNLEPSRVFISFRDLPTEEELQCFQDQLNHNLRRSHRYLSARLLAVAVVSAIACYTGGDDAPKAFFFGDLPKNSSKRGPGKKEQFDEEAETWVSNESLLGDGLEHDAPRSRDPVYNLLLTGDRMSDTGFDSCRAPLAAFLYRKIGPVDVSAALRKCTDVPMTKESAHNLLTSLPYFLVEAVGCELGRVAVSRQERIEQFLLKLKNDGDK